MTEATSSTTCVMRLRNQSFLRSSWHSRNSSWLWFWTYSIDDWLCWI